MRNAALILCFLLTAVLCAPACADGAPASRLEAADYTVEAVLSGRGLTTTVTLRVENRAAAPLHLLVRDIALNGECTGYSVEFDARTGTTEKSVSFGRETLTPVGSCDIGIAELDADGTVLREETLTILPFGAGAVRRPRAADYPAATVALDNETATLLILPENDAPPGRRVLWLYNKSDRLLRLYVDRILADSQLTETTLMIQALPLTAQWAEWPLPQPLPDTLTLSLAGYLSGEGPEPVFRARYDYRLLAPVSVPTMVPAVTPTPQIGTVTVRRSGPVNVRESDNTESRKVGSAKAGATYPCFGVSPAGWYLIRLEDGTEGYITNTLTTLQRQ